MTRVLRIAPQGKDWFVQSDAEPGSPPDPGQNPMVFHSGAAAEAAARLMADALAKARQSVQVLVYLRDGTLVGRYDFAPGVAAPPFEPLFESV